MNLLVAAATSMELSPFIAHINQGWSNTGNHLYARGAVRLRVLITGVGSVATAWSLTKELMEQRTDFAIQAGVAGAYDNDLALGEVVQVESDLFADLGAEDHYQFRHVYELGLTNASEFPYDKGLLVAPDHPLRAANDLKRVSGITVNTVSGSSFTVAQRRDQFRAQVETMEGAAFHFVCLQQRCSFMQIRSLSNYVTPRDRAAWKLPEAIERLNAWLIGFMDEQALTEPEVSVA